MSAMSARQRPTNRPRTGAPDDHYGDLFEIFPDLLRPFHHHTPRRMVMRHLTHVQAPAAGARAAWVVDGDPIESDLGRAYLERTPRR